MTHAEPDHSRGSLVDLGHVSIWADMEGPADGEAVILLAGADSPGFRWSRSVVDPLLEAGYRVLRFDHRDCGRSTAFTTDDAYDLDDLAADTLGLLDHFGVRKAHLIGRSMGAMVAQVIGLQAPHRVLTLTLISTTPAAGDARLPEPSEEFVEKMIGRIFEGAPADRDGRERWIVDLHRLLAGTSHEFEEAAQRALAIAELDTGWVAETGHGVAVHSSAGRLDRLREISAPTLVVHGTADPVYPPAHARALAEGIQGSILVEVEGLGHEFPDALAHEMWPTIKLHLERGSSWTDRI